MNAHILPIIGHHHSPLSQKFGIPRQPNLVNIKSHIRFIAPYGTPDAFVGIEQYSHLWVLWQFHHNKTQANFRPQVRPPRFGGNNKVGVFATRSMYRPSQIGLSVVAFDGIEVVNHQVILYLIGADMADGTPILDIKPYLPFVDSVSDAQGFAMPVAKSVIVSWHANQELDDFMTNGLLDDHDKLIITELIAQDPRPAYRQHEIGVVCVMRYKMMDVGFMMNDKQEMVITEVVMT